VRLQKIEYEKKVDLLEEKYRAMLADNQIMVDQQKLKIEKIEMEMEQVKLNQKNLKAKQAEKVREVKTRLDNFSETRAVSTATKSVEPSGFSRSQIILEVFIGAICAGFLAAIFAIFGERVKERLNEQSAESS
jgi:Na+-translocating ferredoxin:NAD+ oxidoreductase RnfG subunit